ncbi:MAG: glycosyltransferase [Desulfobacterales bacterium]|nr:glycosyltransferase [Desulfobacterales bacterium]
MTETIIFTIDSLGDGGAEKSVLALSSGFQKIGFKVFIITIKDHVVYEIPENIHYISMNFTKGLGFYRILTDLKLKFKLEQHLKKITETHNVRALFSNLIFSDTLISSITLNCSAFFIIRNNYGAKFLKPRKGLRRLVKWRKLKKIYDGKNLISLSDGIKEDMLNCVKIRPQSIRTVNNAFPIGDIELLANEPFTHGIGDYIINVGRFGIQKRHDVLLKAFAKSGVKCQMVLLGSEDKAAEKKIMDLARNLGIKNQIVIPGFQMNPYNWMKNARLFVLSSDFEGFPRVVVEALASGTPVISTDCPSGPSEILKDFPELLSPIGDVDALAKNIARYYHLPPEINKDNLKNYDIDTVVKKLEAIIDGRGKQASN